MNKLIIVGFIVLCLLSLNCTTKRGMGLGPVKDPLIMSDELNIAIVDSGRVLFLDRCLKCHTTADNLKGPALTKITERRRPEWIMNLLLNPTEMSAKDPFAKKTADNYGNTMKHYVFDYTEAREILEYFRFVDNNP